MPRPTIARRTGGGRIGLGLACLLAVGACATAPGDGAPSPAGSTAGSTAGPPSDSAPPIATPRPDEPPAAALAVDGGDPVVGQLGSYVWRGGGSDSPWLPGTPVALGVGETAVVTLAPAAPIAAWRARAVRAGATGPDGALPLGSGAGLPAFMPPTGAWTIAVSVVFADGHGDATYYWLVTAR